MEKDKSKEVYRLRKCTVEPVIGNIKQNLGFREFLLKGLDKVKIEMNLRVFCLCFYKNPYHRKQGVSLNYRWDFYSYEPRIKENGREENPNASGSGVS